jgi:hypothetical protein
MDLFLSLRALFPLFISIRLSSPYPFPKHIGINLRIYVSKIITWVGYLGIYSLVSYRATQVKDLTLRITSFKVKVVSWYAAFSLSFSGGDYYIASKLPTHTSSLR